jgi:FdhD protein
VKIDVAALARVQEQMPPLQRLQRESGATHAAAWAALDGAVHLVREDVGRHNALDKLVGAMVRENRDPAAGFAWISSRASYEMVQKASIAGIGLLAATSAPTARAVSLATECGLAFAGFVRGDQFVAYTFADRFLASCTRA